jgi:HEAT repeat protein
MTLMAAIALGDTGKTVTGFWLPIQPKKASSAVKFGLAAPVVDGFSDPNLIVYDDAYLREYFKQRSRVNGFGMANYDFRLPGGDIRVAGDLHRTYLGRRFRADDLKLFLTTRVDLPQSGKQVVLDTVAFPEIAEISRIPESPWDRDTQTVVYLLSLARYKPAYPLFTRLLKDPSSPVRRSAVRAIGQMASEVPEAVDDLRTLLSDNELRGSAGMALSMVGKAAIPVLVKAAEDPDAAVRGSAIFALGRTSSRDEAVPAILDLLGHRNSEIRRFTLAMLVEVHIGRSPEAGKPFARAFARLLGDEHVSTRRSAAVALLQMEQFASEVEADLRKAAAEDQSEDVRELARQSLQVIQFKTKRGDEPKDPAERAAYLLDDPRQSKRFEALRNLRHLGPKAIVALPALRRACGDTNSSIRGQALHVIGELGPPARPALPELQIAAQDADVAIRAQALRAIARVEPAGREESLPALVSIVSSDSQHGKVVALLALEELGVLSKPAATAIASALSDQDSTVRLTAARVLGKLNTEGSEQAVEVLTSFLKSTDKERRRMAAHALTQIGTLARPAAPALLVALDEQDPYLKLTVAEALVAVDSTQAPHAIQALVDFLGDKEAGIRGLAAAAIGRCGESARSAIGALQERIDDPAEAGLVKEAAKQALRTILPQE